MYKNEINPVGTTKSNATWLWYADDGDTGDAQRSPSPTPPTPAPSPTPTPTPGPKPAPRSGE